MTFLFWLTGVLSLLSLACYHKKQDGPAVLALVGAAFCLRLILARADPFLHNWDERYHALVAKNLLADWTRPLLRAAPVLAYDYRHWCCNSVWLHKQPLFLWQLAAGGQLPAVWGE